MTTESTDLLPIGTLYKLERAAWSRGKFRWSNVARGACRLAVALAAEAFCEWVRPTRTYTASWHQKSGYVRGWARIERRNAGIRRPWQANPEIRITPTGILAEEVDKQVGKRDGEVSMTQWTVTKQ